MTTLTHSVTPTKSDRAINPSHLSEWVEGSGVSEAIAQLAIESLTADELNERIKPATPIKTGGWWCRGVNWRTGVPMGNRYGQGKPDKPHRVKNKPAKYLTAAGVEPDAVFLQMPDEDYWLNIYSDKTVPRIWTEGAKKAGCGLTIGLPTIALTGVWNWGKKSFLAPDVKRWAQPGTTHIICFDSDYIDKESCRAAIVRFGQLLSAESCTVKIAVWDGGYKGMDDFIVANGGDAFKEVVSKALTVKQWEKQFTTRDEDKKFPLPPANVTASAMAELYREKLAWESEYQLWRHYRAKHDGLWSEETVESVRGLVHAYLRTLPDSPPFNAGYVSSVVTILQSDLEAKEWNESKLLPLRDGALDIASGELLAHSPNNRFTWQLPFKWEDRGIGCEPIEEFLLKITGHQQIAEVLLAFLAAIVTRRSDLQRYLELIGGGGTGKSTFMSLAKALAGEDNAVTSRLSLLEKNQFETAKFYRKLLVLFPDSERWQGEVSVLKQLTGQDPIRYERKGVQQCRDYVYEGMVILSANEPPESSDRTSGQERRKLTIGLDNRIPEYEGRNLAEEFKPFLPGLLKRVLEMPRERVTTLIKHTERNVPALAAKKWEQMVETNPIAAWVDECLILDPTAKLYIGKDVPEGDARRHQWAYPNFIDYQKASGHRTSMPVKRFSSNFRDLLKNQMKAPITEHRDRSGVYIQGIGLRSFYDPDGTRYSQPLTGDCDGLVTGCDGLVTAESTGSVGCDGCDGFLSVFEKNDNHSPTQVDTNNQVEEYSENPSHPSHPTLPSSPAVTKPSPNPSQSVTEPTSLPPKGWWALVEDKLAQVEKHYPHGISFKGEGIHGVYRSYRLLTKTEMLQNGLSWDTNL